MGITSRDHNEKLRQIRMAEGLTQARFAEVTGIGLSSIRNYETNQKDVGLGIIDSILKIPRFEKYTLWLMTGKTAPAAGQISPTLSPDGQDEIKSRRSARKSG